MTFFFFKQKTAYEMRISDWSSDVCSSDLGGEVSFLLVQAELASLHQSHGRKSLPWLWLHYASRLNSVVSPLMTKHAAISLVIVAALSSCAIMGQSQARNDGFLVHDAALADPDYLSGLDARPENEDRKSTRLNSSH